MPLDVLAQNAYLWTTFNVVGLVYDGLVTYRRTGGAAGGTLVGALATSAPLPSRDGRTYRFTLRPGVRYSDGRPVRPADFRASMERFLRVTRDTLPPIYAAIEGAPRCVAEPRRCDLSRGIETDGRTGTITIHLTRPDGEFLHKLTMIFADVVPAGTPARKVRRGERLPPGTGPYRVVRWDPDHGGVLERNPYFRSWAPDARPAGLVDRIVVRVRPDERTGSAVADVLRGRVDVVVVADAFGSRVSPARLRALRIAAPGLLHSFPGGSTNWMFLNVHKPPFDDLTVRQALNVATDRARLVELGGGAELATPTCQYVPAGFPGYEPYCPYTAAPAPGAGWSAPDLPRAQRMIARSGATGARVRVWVPDFQREQGRYFARLLRQLGFRPRLRVTPYADYDVASGPLRDRPEMGFFGWGLDYLSAASFIEPTFTCASVAGDPTTNVGGFCDRGVDGFVARALRAPPGEEARAWAIADRHVVDRAPAVPMTNRRALILAGRRVGNVDFHMVWSTLLDRLWVR